MAKSSKNNHTAIKETVKIYFGVINKYARYSYTATLITGIGTVFVFYIPPLIVAQLMRQTADTPLTLDHTWPYVLWFSGAWLAGEVMWRIGLWNLIEFEARAIRDLYNDALDILLKKDVGFFNSRFSGSITKNVIAYGRRIEPFYDTIMFNVTSDLIPAMFALVILWTISPWLSIALIAFIVVGVLIIRPLISYRLKLVKSREASHAAMSGHVSDVVTNIAAIKSYGSETTERRTHAAHIDDFVAKARRSWHFQNVPIDSVISPIYVMANTVGLAIVLSLSVDADTKANLFIGYSYFATVTRFLWSFNSVYRRLEEAIADAALFTEYMLEPPKIVDKPGAEPLLVKYGDVAFDAVAFTHSESKEALFHNLSFTIKSGQKVGLVGQSGAGKSTIVNLLLRFMDVDGGAVRISGTDISTVTQESLHKAIAYVPQEPMLFHRTLRENIAYGKPGASDKEVREAARKANALEFIEKLPNGLDTLVGERGVKLSGGQRQRVAIARAILKDSPILVLDEATSALDSESEKLIQNALEKLMRGRTSIVIAHRLSTIAKMDRIIVIDNGKIVEDGAHDKLLRSRGGIYAKLWNQQSGGFIAEDQDAEE